MLRLHCRQTSLNPRQDLLQGGKELLPPTFGALVELLLIRPEARLLVPQSARRLKRWSTTGLKSFFMSHSAIRCGCVSARQIFSGE
jgi:hypothetical protein